MKQLAAYSKLIRAVLVAGLAATALTSPATALVAASDTVTVATVTGSVGLVIDVPVYIRDTSGTPLGIDQPPGSKIQSYSLKVNYSPASSVQSVTFSRAGITSPLTPAFENSPSSAGSISLLDTFQESTNPIPFTLNGALPGNQVAHLLVTLSPSATVGSVITLTLDPTLTQLTDEAGDSATKETTTSGTLTLVSGAITVVPTIPAMSHLILLMLAAVLAIAGARFIRS